MIKLNNKRNKFLNESAIKSFKQFYQFDGDNIQELFARSATFFSYGDEALAQRIYDYVSQGYMNFSSPIQSNSLAGKWCEKVTDWKMSDDACKERLKLFKLENNGIFGDVIERPISCFLHSVDDTLESQKDSLREIADLSTSGGGIGTSISKIRGASKKAPGVIPYLKVIDSSIKYFNQSSTRRGSICVYLNISHPECERFLTIRDSVTSDEIACININNGLVLTRKFLDAVENDEMWGFICPHTKKVVSDCNARELYQKILYVRKKLGEPMLMLYDEVSDNRPGILKELEFEVEASNLCLSGDTIVAVADGRNGVSISQLAKESNGKIQFPVYSISGTNNAIAFGLGKKKIINIVLSSGGSFKCTKEHEIYLSNGEKIQAKDSLNLQLYGNGLSPIVIKIEELDEYEEVYDLTVENDHNFYILPSGELSNGVLVSNCSEITLPTNNDLTAVCCLSSLNVSKIDEWIDTNIIEDLTTFLDNVLQFFYDINILNGTHRKANNSVMMFRDIGIGQMGFHTYLQQYGIAFSDGGVGGAVHKSAWMSKLILNRARVQSKKLAIERGLPICFDGVQFEFEMEDEKILKINANSKVRMLDGSEKYAFQLVENDEILGIV